MHGLPESHKIFHVKQFSILTIVLTINLIGQQILQLFEIF